MYIQDVHERKVIPTMPNWVMNELICSFKEQEQFESFKNKINLKGLFHSFIPAPKTEDWNSWCSLNWGIDSEARNLTVKYDLLTITFSFDTPQVCPEQFVLSLSELYPNVKFNMITGSMENNYHFEFSCINGWLILTKEYETFKEAVIDGKWGGAREWEMLFEDEQV